MILANAIGTITQYGQLQEPPLLLSLAIGLVVGMAVWALLEFLHFSIALALCGVLISAVSVLSSRYALERGFWMDACAPTLGLLLHRWIVVVEGLLRNRHLGWRVFLSPHATEQTKSDRDPGGAPLVGLVVMLASWPAVAAEMPQVAGRIVGMPGAPTDYQITRGSGQMMAQYYLDLEAGDHVKVLHDPSLMIELADGHSITLVAGETREIAPARAGMSPIQAVARDLFGWLTRQKRSLGPVTAVSMTVRGPDAIALPALAQRRLIGTGSRVLPVGWIGGQAPWQATLRDPAGNILRQATAASEARVMLSETALAVGKYTIEVTDSAGHTQRAEVTVVPLRDIPQPTTDIAAGLAPDQAAETNILWLAGQAQGLWAYEATVRAAGLPHSDVQQVLVETLLRGRVPPVAEDGR